MSDCLEVFLADEAATLSLGGRLAKACAQPMIIFLQGNLGAGKTTLVRGWLQGLGYQGRVKSPTYTLVEPYEIGQEKLFHFDLYRLADPEELEYIGGRDYFDRQATCLVEWPDKGAGMLPVPDWVIELRPVGEGRQASVCAKTPLGASLITEMALPPAH